MIEPKPLRVGGVTGGLPRHPESRIRNSPTDRHAATFSADKAPYLLALVQSSWIAIDRATALRGCTRMSVPPSKNRSLPGGIRLRCSRSKRADQRSPSHLRTWEAARTILKRAGENPDVPENAAAIERYALEREQSAGKPEPTPTPAVAAPAAKPEPPPLDPVGHSFDVGAYRVLLAPHGDSDNSECWQVLAGTNHSINLGDYSTMHDARREARRLSTT